MVESSWVSGLIFAIIMVAALPYIRHVRHPAQNLVAAYLIFLIVFLTSSIVIFTALTFLLGELNLGHTLNQPLPAVLFLAAVLVPSFVLGTWQARKPPQRRGPPQ